MQVVHYTLPKCRTETGDELHFFYPASHFKYFIGIQKYFIKNILLYA
jgi:hypothetical protein